MNKNHSNANTSTQSILSHMEKQKKKRRRETEKAIKRRNNKLLFIAFLFSALLLSLIGRITYLVMAYGDEYEQRVAEQDYASKHNEMVLKPLRGSIMDRNMNKLAVSYAVDTVYVDVRLLVEEDNKVRAAAAEAESKKKTQDDAEPTKTEMQKTIEALNQYLNLPIETLEDYFKTDADGKPVNNLNYFVIKKQVPREITSELMKCGLKYVHTDEDSRREYTHDSMASQVVGFIRGEAKWGLEGRYDTELTGTNGRFFTIRDNQNNTVSERVEPIDGYSLVTTLDMYIQQFAENAVKTASDLYEPENASVIIMNPKTGEVLAMADDHSFNLNDPMDLQSVVSQKFKTEAEALSEEEQLNKMNEVWGNYNISKTFEPGSIFKPMVIAAALEENLISFDNYYYCGGSHNVAGLDLGCWVRIYPQGRHGDQSLTQVLANSCNVGMMLIGEKLGKDLFYQYQHDFGFGEKTGIDLQGEGGYQTILIPSYEQLNAVELATGSFGQGFNCTAIQAINAFCAVINGGNLMKPYVVSQVIDKNNNVIKENPPTVVRKVISQETSDLMRTAMQAVVSPSGTGKNAVIPGYAIGGKTGTAEQGVRGSEQYTVSFIGYLPVENPEIVAMIIINKPKEYIEGSTSAAPIIKDLLIDIIRYKGIMPSGDNADAIDLSYTDDVTVPLDDFTGMGLKDATHRLNELGLDYSLVTGGGNVVTDQFPEAGTRVSGYTKIILYVSEETGSATMSYVPDVVGLTAGKAEETLNAAGLTPIMVDSGGTILDTQAQGSSESDTDKSWKSLTVSDQNIEAHILVEPGTEVRLRLK